MRMLPLLSNGFRKAVAAVGLAFDTYLTGKCLKNEEEDNWDDIYCPCCRSCGCPGCCDHYCHCCKDNFWFAIAGPDAVFIDCRKDVPMPETEKLVRVARHVEYQGVQIDWIAIGAWTVLWDTVLTKISYSNSPELTDREPGVSHEETQRVLQLIAENCRQKNGKPRVYLDKRERKFMEPSAVNETITNRAEFYLDEGREFYVLRLEENR
jgi:hypothetical protein